jgi:Ran GTPase-activating protein (RanGAP) involved in mRNA processing and transport
LKGEKMQEHPPGQPVGDESATDPHDMSLAEHDEVHRERQQAQHDLEEQQADEARESVHQQRLEREPTENDDKDDVDPNPEPEQQGDPHGAPLDDPADAQFVQGEGGQQEV